MHIPIACNIYSIYIQYVYIYIIHIYIIQCTLVLKLTFRLRLLFPWKRPSQMTSFRCVCSLQPVLDGCFPTRRLVNAAALRVTTWVSCWELKFGFLTYWVAWLSWRENMQGLLPKLCKMQAKELSWKLPRTSTRLFLHKNSCVGKTSESSRFTSMSWRKVLWQVNSSCSGGSVQRTQGDGGGRNNEWQ